jgi:phenylalanine-4-hydroxylase
MIGTVEKPIIYGAGLLSSVGESANSITDKVKKLPFDLETVVNTGFDITTQQPQLFVCESFDQLIDAVHEFSKKMAYSIGGTESLIKALESGATSTVEYSSGLQVSGTVSSILKDENGEAVYFNTIGETALSVKEQQLPGHGTDYHHHGFGSPIGKLKGVDKPVEQLNDEELNELGIISGQNTELIFESGVHVLGKVKGILHNEGKIILISLEEATVTYNGKTLFQPEWGVFDMAVGATITSVFGGAADPENFFGDDEEISEVAHLPEQKELSPLEELYGKVREIREGKLSQIEEEDTLFFVIKQLQEKFPNDWLLRLEIVEVLSNKKIGTSYEQELREELNQLKAKDQELNSLIENGLKLIS